MAFTINADKYAYSAAPEKVSESYAAELAKKLVSEEAEARSSEDAALENKIEIAAAEESALRREAHNVLDERITLEVSKRQSEDKLLGQGLEAEAKARLAMESDLLSRLSEEGQARAAADVALRSDISAESERLAGRLEESDALISALSKNKADKAHIHTTTDIAASFFDDGSVDGTLKDTLSMYDGCFSNLYPRVDALETDKADNQVTVTERDYASMENFEKTDTVANILDDLSYRVSMNEQILGQDIYPMLDYLGDSKADRTIIVSPQNTSYTFAFLNSRNYDKRLAEVTSISFTFGNGEYNVDYISGLSFDSGATPTAIDYTDSGILNWVGTDCTNVDGLSIFEPSANTHYDIVFYFNGSQFIGLVNGFVPAEGNVVSE